MESGQITVLGYDEDGSVLLDDSDYTKEFVPGNQWWIPSHDATEFGSKLLTNIIGKRFSFPKSLYAVEDTLRFFVKNKKDALILDFFAGSGTTLHAVNLLNAEDDGNRRCILVTNNEVSVEEATELEKKGLHPGDEEWNKLGIARYVTWPRTICSIRGEDINGKPLKGKYINTDRNMSDGFLANAILFKLGFLDKTAVALGRQLSELIPLLWMKAGAYGECPRLDDERSKMLILPQNRMAILIDEKRFLDFENEIEKCGGIETIYFVTDSEAGYREMASKYNDINTYQLYRDYLDNFRINVRR